MKNASMIINRPLIDTCAKVLEETFRRRHSNQIIMWEKFINVSFFFVEFGLSVGSRLWILGDEIILWFWASILDDGMQNQDQIGGVSGQYTSDGTSKEAELHQLTEVRVTS
ncbi:hypothetical protein RhiirA4_498535 [Rhizophagus irregularis]|uniref:Uncharacterized protein n=1 Tax=Rhizophagus irregularis TaxID=588596 RepID=A0A2I1G3F1_9GLOM|nr:hypothetical protein RhiirA4_498535 [Rhizophagus irregularis]